MSASRGVVDEMLANAVERKISAIDRPTPMIAVSRGSPATTNERNVTISTSSAMMRPTPSVSVTPGTERANRSPPSSTCDPAGSSSRSSAATSCSAVFVAGGTSVAWPSNCMRTIAASPPSETCPFTISLNGSVTARMPSRSSSSAIVSAIPSEYGSSSI